DGVFIDKVYGRGKKLTTEWCFIGLTPDVHKSWGAAIIHVT
ncbi:MAG: hypothetical protein FD130_1191, partial [Halothiobacillaceae bacterium]